MQTLHDYKLLALAKDRQRELERAHELEDLRRQAKEDKKSGTGTLREQVTKAALVLAFKTLD